MRVNVIDEHFTTACRTTQSRKAKEQDNKTLIRYLFKWSRVDQRVYERNDSYVMQTKTTTFVRATNK
jgi:hypothetical protein